MVNLLKETLEFLKEYDLTEKDIVAVQGSRFGISVEDFLELAKNTDYNDGYGAQEIAADLKVIGKDWRIERHEYDGSEWWEFKSYPVINEQIKKIESLENTWDGLALKKEN